MMNSPAAAVRVDGAAVRLADLRKGFGSIQAIRGVDLHIAPGAVRIAGTVLRAAGIRSLLPQAVDDVDPAARQLFGYRPAGHMLPQ